ncbi:ATP-binding cassette sub-family D member 3-like, partial [Mizuhopecten yessoensis]|uniref:ATP-binding cassette sub-family D member 3-like n=1 Tax=Mizuhopecten yessoensis TaxID=6573 RepID=UPI000B45A4A6
MSIAFLRLFYEIICSSCNITYFFYFRKQADIKVVIHESVSQKKERAAVDAVFFGRLVRILKVLIPGWLTAEAWYMFLVAAALIARTYADVWMIQNGTSIE